MATLGSTVVLFGGANLSGVLGDTWTWDGTSWTQLNVAGPLAGSSNGAYLLAALVERGELPSPTFPVDGFAAISGGSASAGAAARFARGSPRPFYVGYGTYDQTTTAGALALIAALEAARWRMRAAPHPPGHGANEIYLDDAFAFFGSNDAW